MAGWNVVRKEALQFIIIQSFSLPETSCPKNTCFGCAFPFTQSYQILFLVKTVKYPACYIICVLDLKFPASAFACHQISKAGSHKPYSSVID